MGLAFFDDDDDSGVVFPFSTFYGGAGVDTFGSTADAGDVTAYGGSGNDKLIYLGQGVSISLRRLRERLSHRRGHGLARPPLRRDR